MQAPMIVQDEENIRNNNTTVSSSGRINNTMKKTYRKSSFFLTKSTTSTTKGHKKGTDMVPILEDTSSSSVSSIDVDMASTNKSTTGSYSIGPLMNNFKNKTRKKLSTLHHGSAVARTSIVPPSSSLSFVDDHNTNNTIHSHHSNSNNTTTGNYFIMNYVQRFGALRGQVVYLNNNSSNSNNMNDTDKGVVQQSSRLESRRQQRRCCQFAYKQLIVNVEQSLSDNEFITTTNVFNEQLYKDDDDDDADSNSNNLQRTNLRKRVDEIQKQLGTASSCNLQEVIVGTDVDNCVVVIIQLRLVTPTLCSKEQGDATTITMSKNKLTSRINTSSTSSGSSTTTTDKKQRNMRFDEFCSFMENVVHTAEQIHNNLQLYITSSG